MGDDEEDTTVYKVVVNHEEQYSIWPADREMPLGWNDVGKSGRKVECLAHIEEVWTDMRPLSLRRKMEEDARKAREEVAEFTKGEHEVRVGWLQASISQIEDALDRGFLALTFLGAQGAQEVGVIVDRDATRLVRAGPGEESGSLHVEGSGRIYAVGEFECVADLDLTTRKGTGRLTTVDQGAAQ